MINIVIESVNVAVNPENLQHLLLLVTLKDSPKLPPEFKILGSSIEKQYLGFILEYLMNTLDVPSIGHIVNVPAVLQIEADNNWFLINFLDDTKQFNTTGAVHAINELISKHMADRLSSQGSGDDSQPGDPVSS